MKREWLFKLRMQHGLKQSEVAEKAEIDRTYYSQIENGLRNPSVDVAKRIAKVLQFEWDLFFT